MMLRKAVRSKVFRHEAERDIILIVEQRPQVPLRKSAALSDGDVDMKMASLGERKGRQSKTTHHLRCDGWSALVGGQMSRGASNWA